MSDYKWDVFASTGKITDYLDYKGHTSCIVGKNGETHANANTDDNPQRTGNT